ncbi:MAG: VanW family protein, partial [Rubrobacter sp.]|nr:VanW family protein [Rubrobacter sp.]
MSENDQAPPPEDAPGREHPVEEAEEGPADGGQYTGSALPGTSKARLRAWLLAGLVLSSLAAAVVALGAPVLSREAYDSGVILEGVEVSGVPLGGKSVAEAQKELAEREAAVLRAVSLDGPGGSSLQTAELGVQLDAAATAEHAYAAGREASLLERVSSRGKVAAGTMPVPPEIEYSAEEVRAAAEDFVEEVDRAPRPASVEIPDATPEVTPAQEGYAADLPQTLADVERMLDEPTAPAEVSGRELHPGIPTERAEEAAAESRAILSVPLTLGADSAAEGAGRDVEWRLLPEEIGELLSVEPDGEGGLNVAIDGRSLREELGRVYSALEEEPVEAGYAFDGEEVEVLPSQAGSRVPDGQFAERLEAALTPDAPSQDRRAQGRQTGGQQAGEREAQELRSEGREVEVPVEAARPELTTERAEELRPTALLSGYSTPYTWDDDPGRRENLRIGASKIDGTFVAPGEIFSYNQSTAPISEYSPAKVIFDGEVEYSPGGGLSQLSSNTFMTAALADLEILEAHPHTAELPYINPGLDTTVWFGELDLRLRNTSGSYVLLRSWMGEDGNLHNEVWG